MAFLPGRLEQVVNFSPLADNDGDGSCCPLDTMEAVAICDHLVFFPLR